MAKALARSIQADLDAWRPAGWEALRSAWGALMPPPGNPRTFGARELDLAEAGYVFERWIIEAFRQSEGVEFVDRPFAVPRRGRGELKEQIDGLVLHGWQAFLLESKLRTRPVDFEPIAQLHVQVLSRPVGTLGLFFSGSGYTPAAVELAESLRPLCVLLFGPADLRWAQEPGRDMIQMVRQKWRAAVRTGSPNLDMPSEESEHGLTHPQS